MRKPKVGEWVRVDFDDVGPRVGIYLGEEKFIEPMADEVSDANGAPVTVVGYRFQASEMRSIA